MSYLRSFVYQGRYVVEIYVQVYSVYIKVVDTQTQIFAYSDELDITKDTPLEEYIMQKVQEVILHIQERSML